MQPTPEQALDLVARIVEAHLLNGPDRRAANTAISTLLTAITPVPKPEAKPAEPAAS